MADVDRNQAQEDFILSIQGLDNSWATSQLGKLVKQEQEGESFKPIADLIA
jgi:hypothetical protein